MNSRTKDLLRKTLILIISILMINVFNRSYQPNKVIYISEEDCIDRVDPNFVDPGKVNV